MSASPGARSGVGLALAVLEEVARAGPMLSANGVARALGIPRTSAYRLINSLVSDEYLLRHPTHEGFVLGVRVVELAHLVAPATPPPTQALVSQLRAETGEAIHFVRYQRGRVVIIDEDPFLPLTSLERTRRQLASTAIGRLLLAAFAPPLAQHDDQDAVSEVVATARSSGITVAEHRRIAEECARDDFSLHAEPGSSRACIAVPLRSVDGRLRGALALASPSGDLASAVRHADRLREAAADLARDSEQALFGS